MGDVVPVDEDWSAYGLVWSVRSVETVRLVEGSLLDWDGCEPKLSGDLGLPSAGGCMV
jgi:hypothetical protein